MPRLIISSTAQLQKDKGTQFRINIGKDAKLNELEYVLIRAMYLLVTKYAEIDHVSFEQASKRYSEAVGVQLNTMYDLEHKHEDQHSNS